MKDDYEFIPSKEFNKLEHEMESLRENPLITHGSEGKQMVESMDRLQGALSNLMHMFEKANEDMTLEQRETKIIQEQLKPIMETMEKVADQNETLANGIVTVSDTVSELKADIEEIKKQLAQKPQASHPEFHRQHIQSPFGQSQQNESAPPMSPYMSQPSAPNMDLPPMGNASSAPSVPQSPTAQSQPPAAPPAGPPPVKPDALNTKKKSLF